jgi:hypothetical protein
MTIPNRPNSRRDRHYCDRHHMDEPYSGCGHRHPKVRAVSPQEDFTCRCSRMNERTLTQAVGKCLPGAVKQTV